MLSDGSLEVSIVPSKHCTCLSLAGIVFGEWGYKITSLLMFLSVLAYVNVYILSNVLSWLVLYPHIIFYHSIACGNVNVISTHYLDRILYTKRYLILLFHPWANGIFLFSKGLLSVKLESYFLPFDCGATFTSNIFILKSEKTSCQTFIAVWVIIYTFKT